MDLSKTRIVVDSSADIFSFEHVEVASAPLKIVTANAEYVDDAALDVSAMIAALASYKGKSGTSCPSFGDFTEAFGDAEHVFCITMTSRLSGTYNVAVNAARAYEEEHPGRRVCVIDSLSTGPSMRLLSEKMTVMHTRQTVYSSCLPKRDGKLSLLQLTNPKSVLLSIRR